MIIKSGNDMKEINKFLKGIHMGGSTFKDYLAKAEDSELKNELKTILESFKRHEEAMTNRIEKIGENAADTLGLMGTMGEFFEKITANKYIICANGKHGNPDYPTLSWIVEAADEQDRQIEIILTNDTEACKKIRKDYDQSEYKYEMTFIASGSNSISVEL